MFWKKKSLPPPPKKTQYDYANVVAQYLPAVLTQGAGASYLGGSIGFKLSAITTKYDEDDYILVAPGDEKWPPVVLFWAGLCYLKFKGGNPKNVAESVKACGWNEYKAIDLTFNYLEGED